MCCQSWGDDKADRLPCCQSCGSILSAPAAGHDAPTGQWRPSDNCHCAGPPSVPCVCAFVGRQREMAELQAALDEAMSGRGRVATLVGEPGIGKTRTARRLAADAARRGVKVLWGRCYDGFGTPPYWLWVQPLREYIQQADPDQLRREMGTGAADIAEIIPEVLETLPDQRPSTANLEPEHARFRLFNSVAAFLKRISQAAPLMVVLDNLHWADTPSILLLGFLAHEISDSRMLVVATYRDIRMSRRHPLSQAIGLIASEPVFHTIALKSLTRADVSNFIRQTIASEPPDSLVEAVYEKTGGNPFFMAQVVRMLAQEGELTSEKLSARQTWNIRIPDNARMVIGRRLEHLSDRAISLLTIASVIGSEFDIAQLGPLAGGLSTEEMVDALEEGLSSRLIEEVSGSAGRYRFSHGLIQHALANELSSAKRARMHAEIGETLERLYGDQAQTHAVRLAYHFSEAASVVGIGKMVHYSVLAGEQALAAYAYEDALTHFERALKAKLPPSPRHGLSLGPPADAETAAILFGLGRAQLATLSTSEAQRTLVQAFETYLEIGDIKGALAVATYPQTMWELLGMTELYVRALELSPPDSHEAGLLSSRYGWALGSGQGDYDGAQRAFERALSIARREGDNVLVARTLARSANVDAHHLLFDEAIEKCRQAIVLAQRAGDHQSAQLARMWASIIMRHKGDLAAADQHVSAMLEAAEQGRDRAWTKVAIYYKGLIAHVRGDWKNARRFNERGLAIAPQDPRLLSARASLEFEQGNYSEGDTYLLRMTQLSPSLLPDRVVTNVSMCIAIPLAGYVSGKEGQHQLAQELAESVLSEPNITPYYAMLARVGLALTAVQKGDAELAAQQAAALHSRKGTFASVVSMDRLLGLLAQTMGRFNDAIAHFERAVQRCSRVPFQPECAWSLYGYSHTLIERKCPGDTERAAALLDDAISMASRLDMNALLRRAMVLKEEAGLVDESQAAPPYPDGLTQREVGVLRLIVQGKSNREIAEALVISLNTVMHHVSSILAKTGSANRAEAAGYAVRRNLV